MPEFHETRAGRTFYERDVPQIVRHLARIADALERLTTTPSTATASAEGEVPRDAAADQPRTEN